MARTRLACHRCQRRKIRCDGGLPRCSNCAKSGVDCTDGESSRSRALPRVYISSIQRRIDWLESIVRHRCPDVDLSRDGPVVSYDQTGLDPSFYNHESSQVAQGPFQTSTQEQSTGSNLPSDGPLQEDQDGSATFGNSPASPLANSAGDTSSSMPSSNGLSHEVGLVSLGANQDPRYIGPSSGYVLCRLMLATSSRTGQSFRDNNDQCPPIAPFLGDLVVENQGPISINEEQASKLCQTYFDIIHVQYPFLHKPTFLRSLSQFFESETPIPVIGFQVYMVLAISATIASRLHKISLSGERYYMSAMQYFEKIQVEGSIQGLQCLLLMLIFTMHSPSVRMNLWYLNYQCIASVLDLGLQRDITTSTNISKLEQEMRTRIFWVVFTLDRAIATMMGRPIGLRDEACDIRLPESISDQDLEGDSEQLLDTTVPTDMSHAIHLFKLARINSEIKYVANSVVRDTPSYAYPSIIDVRAWQKGVLERLDRWAIGIPRAQSSQTYIDTILRLRYHSVRMLLLRPSPAVPRPDEDCLRECYSSAEESIRLFNSLYKKNQLIHNWTTFHSIVLSTITIFYCILAVPNMAGTIEVDGFISNIRGSLSVLSAVGEHWSGAKRSRDILDEMAGPVIRWLMKRPRVTDSEQNQQSNGNVFGFSTPVFNPIELSNLPDEIGSSSWPAFNAFGDMMDGRLLSEQYGTTDCANIDNIVLSLFDDFIPSMPT
ncbi:hypothetical protein F5B20DRAFT_552233 [Whalleya microplaca]|nr:hypothetical protein F5B20DRAFT_552233 [Whalleya microplaca]